MPPTTGKPLSTSKVREPFPARKADEAKAEKKAPQKPAAVAREWADAIMIAFLLAMFIRVFVVELFKIPSPSMTPTLLGTEPGRQEMSYFDVNRDGKEDRLLVSAYDPYVQVYENTGERFVYAGSFDPGPDRELWLRKARQVQDRIIVGKFLYWFSTPKRGDITVFKVPDKIFAPDKPIYIKRVTGLPGETITFEPAPGSPGHENTMGYLVADGERVTKPSFFETQRYEYRDMHFSDRDFSKLPSYVKYNSRGMTYDLQEVKVPDDGVLVMGDNTVASYDGRYWGEVPFNRLRGRAILRYWPVLPLPNFLR